jgi:hypothetical protein
MKTSILLNNKILRTINSPLNGIESKIDKLKSKEEEYKVKKQIREKRKIKRAFVRYTFNSLLEKLTDKAVCLRFIYGPMEVKTFIPVLFLPDKTLVIRSSKDIRKCNLSKYILLDNYSCEDEIHRRNEICTILYKKFNDSNVSDLKGESITKMNVIVFSRKAKKLTYAFKNINILEGE